MVWMGTFTQSFMPSISAQNARILDNTHQPQSGTGPAPDSGGAACPIACSPPPSEYFRILPEIILTIVGTLIMFLEAILKDSQKRVFAPLSIAGLAGALIAADRRQRRALARVSRHDHRRRIRHFLPRPGDRGRHARGLRVHRISLRAKIIPGGEFYALILFSIIGQCIMSAANELIMIFIGLEISSIASYILAGYLRDDPRNNESALKYFLLGSFATAFLLYGIAWIYGITGTTNLVEIRRALSVDPRRLH